MQQNLIQTICLVLGKGYRISDPALTDLFADIHHQCPTLFDTMVPCSEHQVFTEELENKDDDNELDLSLQLVQHHGPKVIGCHKDRFIKSLGVLTCNSQIEAVFYNQLRLTYGNYQIFNIIGFGNGGLRYCKKVSFTDWFVEEPLIS